MDGNKFVYEILPEWKGETCFILGGGPSLTETVAPLSYVHGRIITVNDSFMLFPFSDILFFGDKEWIEDNAKDIHHYEGRNKTSRHILTRVYVQEQWRNATIKHMPFDRLARNMAVPLSKHGSAVAGWCSGSNAINIAFLKGCKRIVLLGFDMKGENWHTRHKRPKRDDCYNIDFIPRIESMAVDLKHGGVQVLNCSMDSALTCFEKMPLEQVLRLPK